MAQVVTINREDVVKLIEKAAAQFTGGNKTAVVALALQHLLEQNGRNDTLRGALRDIMLWTDPTLDMTAPIFDGTWDADTKPWAANLPLEFHDDGGEPAAVTSQPLRQRAAVAGPGPHRLRKPGHAR